VRVHDVGPIAETVRMADALWRVNLGADLGALHLFREFGM